MSNDKEQYLHNPSYILKDGRLDPTKKILLSYILSLSKTEKGCYASNETFGKLLNINPDGASKQISKLKRLGCIETKRLYKNSKEYRFIKVLNLSNYKNINQSDIFINIPYSILFDVNLSSTQKLLLSEIIALLKLPDGCYKSNNDFGELIGVCGSGVSKQIKKLFEMNYITTEEIKIGNVTDHRKIELGTSYTTMEVLPKSLEGTSQKTNGVVPKSQEGTSCGNTINTIINSLDIVPVLPQFTSTEKSLYINELEDKIKNSCGRGEKLLVQAKKNDIDNYWHFGNSNQEVEYLKKIVNEYQDAKNNNK
jgi:Mn-dependent DtxR family transcriptional regulator